MNYDILKTELSSDAAYDAMTDQQAADSLNTVDISTIKDSMEGATMFLDTDPTEYAALTAAKKSEWLSFCGIASHDPANNGVAHLFVSYCFGGGSVTLSNLAASRTELVSRAGQLGLPTITVSHVNYARTL